jgi:NAD(P)H dehydrogenase (quinone)
MVPIAVTGSTGQLGRRVADRLARAQIPQRLLVRNLARAPRLARAEIVQASYGDPDAVASGLSGVRTVLMVSASETPDRVAQHRSFIDAAVRAGIEHLIYVSFIGADPAATFTLARDHWATEQHILASGVTYTFLRDNLYADFIPAMVGKDDIIRGPAGTGRVAVVAQDDIADVAAAVLSEPSAHRGTTYNLTGPEALTLTEIAATLTQITGRHVSYHPETLEEAFASRAAYDAPAWQVEAWVSTYTAIAAGDLEEVSTDVEAITGHAALPFAKVIRGVHSTINT